VLRKKAAADRPEKAAADRPPCLSQAVCRLKKGDEMRASALLSGLQRIARINIPHYISAAWP